MAAIGAIVCAPFATADAQTPPVPCPAGAALVPAAAVHLGHGAQPGWPDHVENLAAFCIDKDEFTYARYHACSEAGSCFPSRRCGEDIRQPALACVSAIEAEAHCQAYGGSLPTEAQWEYAARGRDARPYPWGQQAPVWQSIPLDIPFEALEQTPFGLRHMLDGLAEWTASPGTPVDVPRRIVKGTHDFVRPLWERSSVDERSRSTAIGFRCVYHIGTKTITF